MLIFAVDDEPGALHILGRCIAQAEPGAEVREFSRPAGVLEAVEAGAVPDVLFTDGEMPGMSGADLTRRLKLRCPTLNVVFVTGYERYMGEAHTLHVSGYLKKPITAAKVRTELDDLRYPVLPPPKRVRFRCFGDFEVYIDGEPVLFPREKAKEYLAYLVDRGTLCTGAQVASAVWEGNVTKDYIRKIRKDLFDVFNRAGCGDVLIREWRKQGVRPERVDCDYYDWQKGLPYALNAYHGEYMRQYSWAEMTHGAIAE